MALSAGSRLGPYEIVSTLGVGGMGEVYRATDTNLKRQVAIKVLPETVSTDHDRLARLQREAEVLAALNHQNIAHIHGLEKSDGTLALVMELVEGPTLADRIARGPVPLDEALHIARQIAEAVEAAHEQGIIHRDLKPANVKVRDDGAVKVLDFGLAKAIDPMGAISTAATMSPTITTPALTQRGVILGTAAYMSPEPARGKVVDKRTDIWAFGAVLFEMLTGQRAFGGEDVTETLAAIVRAEPDWSLLPPSMPPTLFMFLRRSLQKDTKQRIGDIRDVRLALEGAFETVGVASSAAPPSSHNIRVAWLMAATAVIGMAVLAVPALQYLREAPPPENRVDIVTPATSDPVAFALSPDGRQIIFAAAGDGTSRLWLRSLSSTIAQPLAGTEGAAYPFWSPDSRSVGFFAEGQLKRLDLGGGAPRIVVEASEARGGTWNADGTIVLAPTIASPLFRVSAAGGDAAPLTKLGPHISHRFPVFLPDGRHFLFYATGPADTAGIHLGSLDGAASTRLAGGDTAGVYLSSGWLLWVRASVLVAQRLDVDKQTLTGDAVPVADAVAVNSSYFGALSVSTSGLIAYRFPGANSRRQLTWFDRTGKVLGTLAGPDSASLGPRLSPNGRQVAVSRTLRGNDDVWLLDGTRTIRFTMHPGRDDTPIWSADGQRIVFASIRNGPYQMYLKDTSGATTERPLEHSELNTSPTDWSRDGRYLLYDRVDPQTDIDIGVRQMEGDPAERIFLKAPFREQGGRFSPDGRWVAYMSDESGSTEIYVRPFTHPSSSGSVTTDSSGQWQLSTSGGRFPTWREDGRELYYISPDGTMMAAPISIRGATLVPGTPASLFPARVDGTDVVLPYDVTRDGRFLINTIIDRAAAAPITLIQNWRPFVTP